MTESPLKPAAFLDRDGVLNVDTIFVHRPDEFVWIDGAREGVRRLNRAGYLVFVVTNQSGIARGLYPESAVDTLHAWMQTELADLGAHIDAFYVCPHHPEAPLPRYRQVCDCRKPAPGMIERAFREWPADRAASFLIGDSRRDIEAATRAGIPGHRFTDGDSLDEMVSALLAGRQPSTSS